MGEISMSGSMRAASFGWRLLYPVKSRSAPGEGNGAADRR